MKRIALIILSVSTLSLTAQDLKKSALESFNKQEYEAAAKAYTKYLKKNDGDSSDWYNLAFSQNNLGKHDDAIKSFQEARKRNYSAPFIYFGTAKAYALKKDEASMLSTWREAVENGFFGVNFVKADPAFADYLETDAFKKVLDDMESNAYPCKNNEDSRHFDFWLGTWDVYTNGQKAGVNVITRAKGGCAIHESYTTAGLYAGQSINFYDRIDKKWHQHWVGSSGDIYNYVETNRAEGMLQFESKYMNPAGQIALSRLTFTLNDDGTVRQLFENSTDDGKTWTPAFDGLYKKQEQN